MNKYNSQKYDFSDPLTKIKRIPSPPERNYQLILLFMFCLRADRARAREPSLACAPLAGRRRRRRRRRGPRGETMTAKKSYYNRGTISPIVFWLAYRGEESRGGAFIGFMRQQWLVIQRTFRGYLLFLPPLSLSLPQWLTRALPYIYMYIYIYIRSWAEYELPRSNDSVTGGRR